MENKYFKDIGQRIRAKRTELGYSATDLSRISGISASAITRLESGKVKSRPGTVKCLYAALGINPGAPKPDMTEKQLEQKFVNAVKEFGGAAYKFTSPGHSGVPDRLVILPIAKMSTGEVLSHYGLVEVKKPGAGELSPVQEIELKRLTRLGARCYILDDPGKINAVIKDIETGWNPKIRYGIQGQIKTNTD